MKISQMLLREDFYSVNRKTLSEYFKNADKESTLYIYPHLNAIVTARPSNKVKNYLISEYSINGNPIKALLVRAYVKICLLTHGVLASNKIRLKCDFTDDMLIYPCNKKYRIFDFAAGSVDVISKSGFPRNDLIREIKFRVQNKEEFIPGIIELSDMGYSEKIINGIPLARLKSGFYKYQKLAIENLEKYSERQGKTKIVSAKEYADNLLEKIIDLSDKLEKNIDKNLLVEVVKKLLNYVEDSDVKLVLSHGDLQPGNIWVENSGKMYIIDWESWGIRSEWYDIAALYGNLRNGNIDEFLENCDSCQKAMIIALEDIIYKLNELSNLPYDYGEKDFELYLYKIASFQKGLKDV